VSNFSTLLNSTANALDVYVFLGRIQRIQKAYCNPENYRRRDLAIKLAKQSNLKLAQIAMLYPLTKGQHISVIFGSSKPDHLDDMVALQHLNIDKAAMELFDSLPEKKIKTKNVPFTPQYILDQAVNNVTPLNRKQENRIPAFSMILRSNK